MSAKERAAERIAAGIFIIVNLARVFSGIDFTDDGYGAALVWRLGISIRELGIELGVHKPAAVFSLPVVWLYRACGWEPVGFVIALRLWLLAMAVGALIVAFRGARTFLSPFSSSVFAVAFAGIALGWLFTPGYNALGALFFGAGLVLLASWAVSLQRRRGVLGGVLLGASVVAYPTLAVVVVPTLLITLATCRAPGRHAAALAFLIGTAPLWIAVLMTGLGPLREQAAMYASDGGAVSRSTRSMRELWALRSYVPVPLIPIALAVHYARRRGTATLLGGFLIMVLWRWWSSPISSVDQWWRLTMTLAVAFPIVFPLTTLPGREPTLRIWLPAVAAGCVATLTSWSGHHAFLVGAAPAAALTIAFLTAEMEQALAGRAATLLVASPALALPLAYALHPYRDHPLLELDTTVRSGPFAGIRTTQRKAAVAEEAYRIARSIPVAAKVIYLDDFPAGYLGGWTPPGLCAVWAHSQRDRGEIPLRLTRCARAAMSVTTYVVRMRVDARDIDLAPLRTPLNDLLVKQLTSCGSTVSDGPDFRVLSVDPSRCGWEWIR